MIPKTVGAAIESASMIFGKESLLQPASVWFFPAASPRNFMEVWVGLVFLEKSLKIKEMSEKFHKLKNIKMLVMDVDGVLTDARIILDSGLGWMRFFSVRDGIGIHRLRHNGYKTAVITGSHAEDVRLRVQALKIDYFYENKLDKKPAYENLKEVSGFRDQEISYIGDDIFDVPLLKQVGFSATVPEAVEEVLNECDYVTKRRGGYGAVREICQLILKYGYYN